MSSGMNGKWAKSVVREERGRGVWLENAPGHSDVKRKAQADNTVHLSQPVQPPPPPARTLSSLQPKPAEEQGSAARGHEQATHRAEPHVPESVQTDPSHLRLTTSAAPASAAPSWKRAPVTATSNSIFSAAKIVHGRNTAGSGQRGAKPRLPPASFFDCSCTPSRANLKVARPSVCAHPTHAPTINVCTRARLVAVTG